MPIRPLKQCVRPGCPHRVEDTKQVLCVHHRKEANKAYDKERGSSASRGYGARWRRLRKLVLNRDPLCRARILTQHKEPSEYPLYVQCAKPSTDADHIISKRDGGRDAMDNLQGLCHACHSAKTAKENERWGK